MCGDSRSARVQICIHREFWVGRERGKGEVAMQGPKKQKRGRGGGGGRGSERERKRIMVITLE